MIQKILYTTIAASTQMNSLTWRLSHIIKYQLSTLTAEAYMPTYQIIKEYMSIQETIQYNSYIRDGSALRSMWTLS